MTIPTLDPNTARDTKVVLHHYGSDYYFDKIWVQGKDYGYEFPLPQRREGSGEGAAGLCDRPGPILDDARYILTLPPRRQLRASSRQRHRHRRRLRRLRRLQLRPRPRRVPRPTTRRRPACRPLLLTRPTEWQMTPRHPRRPPCLSTSAGWLMMVLGGGSLSGLGMAIRRRR